MAGPGLPVFESQGGMTSTFKMGPEGHLTSVEVEGKREREGPRSESDVCEDVSLTLPGEARRRSPQEDVTVPLLPPPLSSYRAGTADGKHRGCGKTVATDVPGPV